VRVFGGLELWHRGRQWRSFETRKAAALFGYLVVNEGRQVSRSALAALLWPEAGEARGRKNLRQALYTITTSLPRKAGRHSLLVIDSERVGLDPEAGLWSDIAQLLDLLGGGTSGVQRRSTYALARAVQLYRGDILAGLQIRDAAEFELWLLAEQERVRYLVIDALQELAEAYLARGEHRLGIQYARRLVTMDPLHEDGHRLLMTLLAAAGNRAAAASHYRALTELLERELGVPPAEQTTEHYQRISAQVEEARVPEAKARLRPYVPLVGREHDLEELRKHWRTVASGRGRLTVVEGELGVGKSRLVRSFLDELAAKEVVRVLAVATEPRRIQPPFTPMDSVLRLILLEVGAAGCDPIAVLTPLERQVLAAVAPGLTDGVEVTFPGVSELSTDHLARGCAALLRLAEQAGNGGGHGLVIFLDDLHFAPASGLDLLREVARLLAHEPVWFLGTCDRLTAHRQRRLAAACEAMSAVTLLDFLSLSRLSEAQVAALAAELVTERAADEVARQLMRVSGGLPLGIVMQLNLWWDEGRLVPASSSGVGWELVRGQESQTRQVPHLMMHAEQRVGRLSPFLRRVLTLAATLGNQFDAHFLADVEGESQELMAFGLDGLLDRLFLLTAVRDWSSGRPQGPARDWEWGVRLPRYEFDHEVLRQAVLGRVSRERRRALHGRAAEAVVRLDPGAEEEVLAHHHTEAGNYPRALAAVRRALDRRRASGIDPACLVDLLWVEKVLARAVRWFDRWSAPL
jgi:DNA-binding SARP family transcriptional activator